jgi:hypothetical protein
LNRVRALVGTVEQDGSAFEAQFRGKNVEVDVDARTRIVLANGSRGSLTDLVGSQLVTLTGLYDSNTSTMIQTTEIHLVSARNSSISVSANQPSVGQGPRIGYHCAQRQCSLNLHPLPQRTQHANNRDRG